MKRISSLLCVFALFISLISPALPAFATNGSVTSDVIGEYHSRIIDKKFLNNQSKQSRGEVSANSLQYRTSFNSQTTTSATPTLTGTIPNYCNDVGIAVYSDTSDLTTGTGFYVFTSEAGMVQLEPYSMYNSQRQWTLDLAANGLGLVNGYYHIYVTSKCDYSTSYADPLYADVYDDALYIVPAVCDSSCTPVHRFYNKNTGAHFYTSVESEKRQVMQNSPEFRYEGIAAFARRNQASGTIPVHRFYNTKTGTHFYTAVQYEATNVNNTMYATYRYEGIAYYAYANPDSGTIAMHRFYKFKQGVHFYTASQYEASAVNSTMYNEYRYEGVSYHVIAN